ncbi:uncharacterized protein LOC105663583 [Megachile rotundata]|uniref:uncharacterized protein LOC105663583 n=1 Tax=Megachile rotundata TaxID=143995 RepID=UPI003FD33B3E
MRLNQIYFHTRRLPQKENKVPFKELYPLKLKNYVSGVSNRNTENKCLFEMMIVFTCWQKTEFDSSKCSDVIQNLEICHDRLRKNMKEEKISKKKDIPTPGAKSLTDKQLNYILRQYPTV